MMQRLFWSFNVSFAGALIGLGLYSAFHTANSPLISSFITIIGFSHALISLLCYRKFVGKGLLFEKKSNDNK